MLTACLGALAHLELACRLSAAAFMRELGEIRATLVRTDTGRTGRRPTVMLAPDLSSTQQKAAQVFELARWLTTLSSTMTRSPQSQREKAHVRGLNVRQSR